MRFRCEIAQNLKNHDLWNRCSGDPGASEIVSGKVLGCSKSVSMVSDRVGMPSAPTLPCGLVLVFTFGRA